MYINYVYDRKKLGFTCIKDVRAANQISDLKNFIKRTTGILVFYIVKKGKQLFIIIFSKEVLIAVLIFVNSISMNVDPNVYRPSSEVYPCCISNSNNLKSKKILESSKFPSPILDSILNLNGGYDDLNYKDDLNDKEKEEEKRAMEKLLKSVLSKSPGSSYRETSPNKLFLKTLELITQGIDYVYPVISDQRLWKLIVEWNKPIQSNLGIINGVPSIDILNPAQNAPDKQVKTIFADALSNPQARRKPSSRSTMEKSLLNLAQNSNEDIFANGLTPSGLSVNHRELSTKNQFIEKLTQDRRAQPLYPSNVMGESFQYSYKQLTKKGRYHLPKDFGIYIEGKTNQEVAKIYFDIAENLLQRPNLVVRTDGTLNKQEATINYGDPESKVTLSFENNPLYDKKYFITLHKNTPNAFDNYDKTGNLGLSPAERKLRTDEVQKVQAKTEREQKNAIAFYSTLPNDARISYRQLAEFEGIQQQLKTDPNFQPTDKQKTIMERGKKYQKHKQEFDKNNPKIFDDEL